MHNDFPDKLENDRVTMSRLLKEHAKVLEDIALSDPNLLQYSPSEIHTKQKLDTYIEVALKSATIGQRIPYIVYDKKLEGYAGCTSFGNYYPDHKRIEIGWTWIGKPYQKTDLNRNMKFLMLSHAFDFLKLNRVEFRIDERNQASRKAVEKIGGQLEGILKKHTILSDGYLRNTCYYSILDDSWPGLKKEIFHDLILQNGKR
jgi:RimJ/RimL family protein N-acetyltransferase